MVAVALVSVLTLATASLIGSLSKSDSDSRTTESLLEVKMAILRALENPEDFKRTLALNPAFACIQNGSDCASQGGEFLVYKANPDLVLPTVSSTTVATDGFDSRGQACNSYDAVNGDDGCPFKYVATWVAFCPSGQNIKDKATVETICYNPLIEISVNFSYKYKNAPAGKIINQEKMAIRTTKAQTESKLAKLCAMVGTVAVGTSCVRIGGGVNNCEGTCGATVQALVEGFNDDGTPICTCTAAVNTNTPFILEQSCNSPAAPFGRVVLGFNPDGTLDCGDGLRPAIVAGGWLGNPTFPMIPYTGGS